MKSRAARSRHIRCRESAPSETRGLYQNALWDREAMVGVRPCERSPVSILYKTNPCANAMPTRAPVKTIRLSIICDSKSNGRVSTSRIANGDLGNHAASSRSSRALPASREIDLGPDIVVPHLKDVA